jgi:dolichol kinase
VSDHFKYYLFYTIAYGIILLLGEAIFRLVKGGYLVSRNFSHLAAGVITLPFPWLFTSHWWVLLLVIQSSLVLYATRVLRILPSHHRIAGKSLGSYLFFASVYLCFMASFFTGREELFVIPLLVLTFSDVAAALVGRTVGKRVLPDGKPARGGHKTYAGSIAFFITALVILFPSLHYFMPWNFAILISVSLFISLFTTVTEAFSPYGTDNFFIPLIILIFMQIIYFSDFLLFS